MNIPNSTMHRAFTTIRRFAQRKEPAERCEMCSVHLPKEHEHLIEPAMRHIVCACQACALLFDSPTQTRYRRIPKRTLSLADFQLSDAQWESLTIPINMAFFFESSVENKVIAMYPTPAGATESLLDLSAWRNIVDENPVLKGMQTDVEALLVNRITSQYGGATESSHFLVPMDKCFQLVGLIRTHWHGLSGGTEVWQQIKTFFASLKENAECPN